MPSFGGEVKPLVSYRRFAACNRYLKMACKSPFVSKITGHFSPIVPLSLLEVSLVVVGVRAPGGASGNYQNRTRTISLHGYSTSGGTSHRGPMEGEEEKKNKRRKRKIRRKRKRKKGRRRFELHRHALQPLSKNKLSHKCWTSCTQ
jgi:hypothetical protein